MPPQRARPGILSPAYWHPPAAGRAGGKLRYGPVTWRPGVIPVRAFTRPLTGIPLTGGQGTAIISSTSTVISTPAPVQSQSNSTSASGTSLTVTLANPTTAGNCLIVCSGGFDSTTPPVVSGITLGGAAGNFAAAANEPGNPNEANSIWVDQNCAGGQTSVVITFSGDSGGSPGIGAWVMEWSGIALTSPTDKSNANQGTGTSWTSNSTGTLSQANELVIGSVCSGASTTPTLTGPGAPWTNLAQVTFNAAGGVLGLLAGYQVVTATTAQTYSGTESGGVSPSFGATIATFRAKSTTTGVAGNALISVGPQGLGNVWYPAQVTISTTSGVNDTSTCQVFLGPAGVPVTLLGTIFPGGIGTLGAAVPPLAPGQYLIAQWTGGNPGDVAAINVIGTMDSVMPG